MYPAVHGADTGSFVAGQNSENIWRNVGRRKFIDSDEPRTTVCRRGGRVSRGSGAVLRWMSSGFFCTAPSGVPTGR